MNCGEAGVDPAPFSRPNRGWEDGAAGLAAAGLAAAFLFFGAAFLAAFGAAFLADFFTAFFADFLVRSISTCRTRWPEGAAADARSR